MGTPSSFKLGTSGKMLKRVTPMGECTEFTGPDAVPLLGAMVGVEGVSLAGVNAPKAVDAAKVNPAPKPKARPRK
jgi:hypothetical protein